jgi:hypothetical protein
MDDAPLSDNNQLHAFKQRLFQHCQELLQQRIATAISAMDDAQSAANSEEKSSAGDKYETARGMAQLNKEMFAGQLQSHRAQLGKLKLCDPSPLFTTLKPGALAATGAGYFFIATGLGKILFEQQTVWVISPDAPVSAALAGRKKGDAFSFNQQTLTILDVV